jgi:hypothetical protein
MTELDPVKLPSGDLAALLDAVPSGPHRDRVTQQIINGLVGDALRDRLRKDRAARSWKQPEAHDQGTLAELLTRPPVEVPFLVDGLQGRQHNVGLTGQYKVGKTMLVGTYAKALVDGEPFLGRPTYLAADQTVAWLNFEMDADDLLGYLRPLGVRRPDRLSVLNLRGLRLPLLSDPAFDWLKEWLIARQVGALVIDSWRRLCGSSGVSENSNEEVEPLTERIDQLKRETGVGTGLITAHTPRAQAAEGEERARGATAFDDWVDARWVLTRQGKARFLAAQGRGVPERERALVFDETTNLITVGGGDRRAHRREEGVEHVVNLVAMHALANGGGCLGKNELKRRLEKANDISHNGQDLERYIREAEAAGRIHWVLGPRKATCYRPGRAETEATGSTDSK